MPAFRVVIASPLWLLMASMAGSSQVQVPPPGTSAAKAPIGDTPGQRSADTASISGTVTAWTSSEPVGAVEISLYGRVLGGRTLSTLGDARGRFLFKDLVPGRYTVGAAKPGFASVLQGQRRVGAPGRAVLVAAGEHRDVRLRLPRLGSISGTIVDDLAEPLSHRAMVSAWRFTMSGGYRRATAVSQVTPDRDGHYRLDRLIPGDYAVCASSRQTEPLDAGQRLRAEIDRLRRTATFAPGPAAVAAQEQLAPKLAELEARLPAQVDPVRGFLPSCLPGTSKGPSRVSLAPEESRTGVDFRLAGTRLARVEGRVNAARPVTLQVGDLWLVNADARLQGGVMDSARPDLDGRFTLPDVVPGRYALMVHSATEGRLPAGRVALAGAVDVIIGEEDVSDIVLEIQQGATVAGQVVFEGGARPDADVLAGLQVRLDPTVQEGPLARYVGPFIAPVDPNGRFVLRNVFPGAYRLWATVRYTPDSPAPRWFANESAVSGRDAMYRPLTIASGESITDAVVTMTDRRATITGTILTGQGEPATDHWILVYPSDERERPVHAWGMIGVGAGEDGTFSMRGLRAGSYRVVTFAEGAFGDWYDPEFLRQVEGRSTPLPIAEAEQKTLHLRVPGGG